MIVYATIIEAPASTRNYARQRDPEMHQTRKSRQWHFGMKLHIGSDAASGMVHRLVTTPANVHDLTVAHELLHGGETTVWSDAGYQGISKRAGQRPHRLDWQVALPPGRREARAEQHKASIRARVEHPFLDVKPIFGYAKVRYRDLHKNTQRLAVLLGFSNLLRSQRHLAALASRSGVTCDHQATSSPAAGIIVVSGPPVTRSTARRDRRIGGHLAHWDPAEPGCSDLP